MLQRRALERIRSYGHWALESLNITSMGLLGGSEVLEYGNLVSKSIHSLFCQIYRFPKGLQVAQGSAIDRLYGPKSAIVPKP